MKDKKKIAVAGARNPESDAIMEALTDDSFFLTDREIGETAGIPAFDRKINADVFIIFQHLLQKSESTAITELKANNPDLKILIIADAYPEKDFLSVIRKGADGYVPKNISKDELVFAVKHISNGHSYISPEFYSKLLSAPSLTDTGEISEAIELSQREKQILQLIMEGYSNQEIAYQLFTTKNTVMKHRKNLIERTGSANMVNLLRNVINKGIISALLIYFIISI